MPFGAQVPQVATPLVSLYIGNLDKDIDRQKLYDHLTTQVPYDRIDKIDLKKDFGSDESRGFAFVYFKNQADAARIKSAFNHAKIKDKELTVSFVRNRDQMDPNANLFFRHLPKSHTGKDLEEMCQPYGSIVRCKIKYDEADGSSLGYGYVQFEKEIAAKECMEALNGKMINDKVIEVLKFQPQKQRNHLIPNTNLYIKEFPSKWTEKQVNEFIDKEFQRLNEKSAKIVSKAVSKDQKFGKYYAFVAYQDPAEAREVMERLNNHEFPGEEVKLYVGFAQTKEQRRKALRDKHASTKSDTNLFIKSLAAHVDEASLTKAFQNFGTVTSVAVKTHELSRVTATGEKKSLKFGFINFQDVAMATKALAEGKTHPEVLALIDPSHYKGQDFLHFHQNKAVRNQYLKMDLKNKRTTQHMAKTYKMLEAMMAAFTQNQGGRPGQQRNNNARNQGQYRPGPRPDANMMMPFMMNQFAGGFPGVQQFAQPALNPQVFQQMMLGNMMPQAQMFPQAIPQPMPIPVPSPAQVAQPKTRDVNWIKNNTAEFELLSPEEKKTILGNLMYWKVSNEQVSQAMVPKITGMLIDLDTLPLEEIIEMLENPAALKERIQEAVDTIETQQG